MFFHYIFQIVKRNANNIHRNDQFMFVKIFDNKKISFLFLILSHRQRIKRTNPCYFVKCSSDRMVIEEKRNVQRDLGFLRAAKTIGRPNSHKGNRVGDNDRWNATDIDRQTRTFPSSRYRPPDTRWRSFCRFLWVFNCKQEYRIPEN